MIARLTQRARRGGCRRPGANPRTNTAPPGRSWVSSYPTPAFVQRLSRPHVRGVLQSYDSAMGKRPSARKVHGVGVAVCACVCAASQGAAAHHSISAVYDGARQQRVEGIVAEFQFVNPHPFVIVTVDNEPWRLEMDNRFELDGVGMTSETLQPGDRVVVSGSLGRTEPRTLYIRQLDRPADGFRYEQVGSRPRVSSTGR